MDNEKDNQRSEDRKMHVRSNLEHVRNRLHELEAAAREKLENKNFADIVKLAAGRIQQLIEHPDADRVQAAMNNEEYQERPLDPLNSGGNMLFSAGDPGRTLQADETARRAMFPDPNAPPAPFPGVADKDAQTYHPGDPKFSQEDNNQDFRDPNNVDLNHDGTLRRAPNAPGQSDVRKE